MFQIDVPVRLFFLKKTSLKSLLAPKREDKRINTKAALTRINTFKDVVTVSRFPSKSQDLWDLEDF